jgi:hypothetical protein
MGEPRYRATDGALEFDAYYIDEWGVVNDDTNTGVDEDARSGFHKSRFSVVTMSSSGVTEESLTTSWEVENKADPNRFSLTDTSNPIPKTLKDKFEIQLVISTQVNNAWIDRVVNGRRMPGQINVTVFYAVGHELNRHGLRSFVEQAGNMSVVVLVPGIESQPRFGRAIKEADVKDLLKRRFGVDLPFTIRNLACFSTGSCGMNQTLLNELLPLGNVRRLVFYDCLYSLQCGNTAKAIQVAKDRAGEELRIVVYKTSEGGNSFVHGTADLEVVANHKGLIDRRGVIANLYQKPRYISLVIFRALEAAVLDGAVVLDKGLKPLFSDMRSLLASHPRGSIVSNKETFDFVHGSGLPQGTVDFDTWSNVKANAKVIDAFYKKVGKVSAKGTFRHALWGNSVPGWPGGDGEDKHDLLLPEFGWEYLT